MQALGADLTLWQKPSHPFSLKVRIPRKLELEVEPEREASTLGWNVGVPCSILVTELHA